MQSSDSQPETPSSAAPRRRLGPVAWAAVALGGVVVVTALAFRLRATGILKPPIPTPACVEPILTLGTARYRIEPIQRAADGTIAVPKDAVDIAYWVEGTNVNYVFALTDSSGELALRDSLRAGDEAMIQWADCMTDTYTVQSIQSVQPDLAALTDQSAGGLTAFVKGGSPENSLLIKAGRHLPPTPEAAVTEEVTSPQTDMAFGEMTTSPDGNSVSISVTITNTGAASLTITDADLSLTPENGEPQPPVAVEPALPQELAPGAGVALQISFSKPRTNTALLRILDVTMDRYF